MKNNKKYKENKQNKQNKNRAVEKSKSKENTINQNDYITGRHSVIDYIKSGKSINKLFVQIGATGSINEIKHLARENKIPVIEKDKNFFMQFSSNHQGVALQVPPYQYCQVEDMLSADNPFILILDGIEDVNNLGAIIRTAECGGLDGIIIPKRGAATVNATVAKVAQGALSNIKIAQVTNINDTIIKLKEKGLWIVGTSLDDSSDFRDIDYKMPLAIVVGNESKGISQKTLEKCDFKVKIPIYGKTQSLNVSVATGIIIYEALNQRK